MNLWLLQLLRPYLLNKYKNYLEHKQIDLTNSASAEKMGAQKGAVLISFSYYGFAFYTSFIAKNVFFQHKLLFCPVLVIIKLHRHKVIENSISSFVFASITTIQLENNIGRIILRSVFHLQFLFEFMVYIGFCFPIGNHSASTMYNFRLMQNN